MSTLRLILGDQLTRDVAALDGLEPDDVILMVEVHDETVYAPHHKQKITLILSAMRHFAQELRDEGLRVDYVKLDARGNTGSFTGEVKRALKRTDCKRVVATEPGEWRVLDMMRGWSDQLDVPVEIRDDDRFLCSRARFARWAADRKSYRMEFFYRDMRRETGLLMEEDQPAGGQWNYDHDNRKALPAKVSPPERVRFAPDAITQEVMTLVARRFDKHFGDLDSFSWGVTRADALTALKAFIKDALPQFGDYQDAMKQGEPFLFHATISPYLNCGLLSAREVCVAAELAWRKGQAPLNAVEGFIRQILGWREYVRGIYWLRMPDYAQGNALEAKRPLPWCYWSGETKMNCIAQVVAETRANAYAHHIQRLMVTGVFGLIASIDPKQVEEWYLAVYADAYEWVELPNTHGMALFADGGLLASKPYAASGAYIDRMSDYCKSCAYDVRKKSGPDACPFNYLYWRFLIVNEQRLSNNPRLGMPYRTLAKMTPARRQEILDDAEAFLDRITNGADAEAPAQSSLNL